MKQLKALARWLGLSPQGGVLRPASKANRRRDLIVALLIASSAFLIYNANMRTIAAGDTYAARYLPLSIWRHQSLHLDPVAVNRRANGTPYRRAKGTPCQDGGALM